MPHKPTSERRSSGSGKPPTALGLKAQKPMTKSTKIGVSFAAAVIFALAVSTFVQSHFLEKHTEAHDIKASILEYGPFAMLVMFALALFVKPEETVQFILKTLDRVVGMVSNAIPALRGKERRNGG